MTGVVLDDADSLHAADAADVLRAVAASAAQVREGALRAADAGVARLAEDGRPRAVLVVGPPATAELLTAVAGPTAAAPVVAVAGAPLPAWVGAADLVVVASGDGTEPEVLLAAEEAARRGCRLLVVAPSGSPLEERGERGRAVVVALREAAGSPAAAQPWPVAVPVLAAAAELGLAPAGPHEVEAAAAALERVAERCRPDAEVVVNPAKALAQELSGTLPLVWGTTALTGAAARRAAAQLAATAATPAVPSVLPEGLELLGGPWTTARPSGDDFFRDRVDDADGDARTPQHLVLLRDPDEPLLVARRALAVAELAPARGVAVSALVPDDGPALARLAELVGTTAFAAVYLALLEGTPPLGDEVAAELAARTR